ncbi:WhiB family transcriptional regulator [Streptomyces sp. NPDC005017]|uniref:WhiB family transcriptional regulator n=1 Tax=Streptomyces sp. NPDC005017 TaxID=3364706 RepID=UPI003674BADA
MSPSAADGRGWGWELDASCRFQDAELWFSERTRDLAVAVCQNCPVLLPCRETVLKREEGMAEGHRGGIVAGLTGPQRYALERAGSRQGPAPDTESAPGPTGRPRREPAPCGTRAAYQRHLRLQEPVDDACRAANARGAGFYRRTGSTRAQPGGPAPPAPRSGQSGHRIVHRTRSSACPHPPRASRPTAPDPAGRAPFRVPRGAPGRVSAPFSDSVISCGAPPRPGVRRTPRHALRTTSPSAGRR